MNARLIVFLVYRIILNLIFTAHIVLFSGMGVISVCFGVVWMLSDSMDVLLGHTNVIGVHVGIIPIVFGIYTVLVNIPQLLGVIISKSVILCSDILQTFVGMGFVSLGVTWIFGIFFRDHFGESCNLIHTYVGNYTVLETPVVDNYLAEFCGKFAGSWDIPYILIPAVFFLFIGIIFQSIVSHQIITARGYNKRRKKKLKATTKVVKKTEFVTPDLPEFEQQSRFEGGVNFSHKDIDGDDNVTDYFIADDALDAMNWLDRHQAIDTKKYRVIVQTPNGNWGLNYQGGFCHHPVTYNIAQIPISGYNDGETCKIARVAYPFKASMRRVKDGVVDKYTTKVTCGLCETSFWAEIDVSGEDYITCLKCAAENTVAKDFTKLTELIDGPTENPIAAVAKRAREFLDSNEDVRVRISKAADVLEEIDNQMVAELVENMRRVYNSYNIGEMELMNYCGNFQVQIEDMIEAIYRTST